MEHIAALRAEWLARLAEAIEGAQRVASQLHTYESASVEAGELYSQLEAARLELELLRGVRRRSREPMDQSWLEQLGLAGPRPDSPD